MEPRFTADGKRVVLIHDVGGGHNEVFAIDVNSGNIVQLTSTPGRYPWKWRPSLDSSGTRLIVTYGSDPNGTVGLHSHIGVARISSKRMASDFVAITPVDTLRPSYDGEFSPDGTHVVFDAGGGIWTAKADGTDARRIASGRLGRFSKLVPGTVLYTHDSGPAGTHVQLWRVGVDGANPHPVADGNFAESFAELP